MLKGDGRTEELQKFLSDFKNKQELVTYLARLSGMDKTDIYQAYAGIAGYESVPVSIDKFIEDDYYLGQVLGNEDGSNSVYECWRETLRKVYPNPFHSPFLEVILSGAIGIGKTTVGVIGGLYDCHKLECLKSPQYTFGLVSTTRIVYALLSIIKELSQGVILDQLYSYVNNSKYFRRLMEQAEAIKKRTGDKTLFPKRIDIIAGSKLRHTLSQAVFGAILDEINFGNDSAQFKIYTSILARMKSRFMQCGGVIPGHLWLLSSKKDETDTLEKHIKNSVNVKTTLVEVMALWEVKTHNYTLGKWFPVYIGNEFSDPLIITEEHTLTDFDPDLVIYAPMEHWQDFNNDIGMALNDLAGVASVQSKKLIKSKQRLLDNMQPNPNPVKKSFITLSIKEDDQIQDFINWRLLEEMSPDKSTPRYIHMDLSVSGDATAVACCRPDGVATISRVNPMNMCTQLHHEPRVRVEWVVALKPEPGNPIPYYKIRMFIVNLRERGYNIERVSADGFQSHDMRQMLELAGFTADLLSVDRKKEPYQTFRNAITESRCQLPWHETLFDELSNISDTGKKYDHIGEGSSKDLADACCGAVYNLLTNNKGITLNRPQTFDEELREALDDAYPNSGIFDLPGQFVGGL